jgi:hypothetical protein
MKQALEPIGRTILLHGCTEGVGIVDRVNLTPEQLVENDYLFQRCGKLLGWEWADNTAEMMDREMRSQARQLKMDFETAEDRASRSERNVRKYAEARGLEAHTMLVRVCVADFFPLLHRRNKLSFTHHIEVWRVGMTLEEACAWLERAEREKMSVSQLRAAIKTSKPTPEVPEPDIDDDIPSIVSDFECWAATSWSDMQKITPMEAFRLLAEMQTAVRLVDHLRSVITTHAGPPQSL